MEKTMSLDQTDQNYIKTEIKTAIDSIKAEIDKSSQKNDNEFLMHLYDALWENMRSKEGRLWTFLSLYGAAVGLVFAGGQSSQIVGAELFALVIVMALTVWAVLIILNANWWYYRNQLMVTRIENRLPNAIKGVVPKPYYDDPNYHYEPLSKSSIFVLAILLALLYARTIWNYHGTASFQTLQSLVLVLLLYFLFSCSAIYCLSDHENNINSYYKAKKGLLSESSDSTAEQDANLAHREIERRNKLEANLVRQEIKTRNELNARPYVLALLTLIAVVFDFVIHRNSVVGLWFHITIISQAIAAIIFGFNWRSYSHPIDDVWLDTDYEKLEMSIKELNLPNADAEVEGKKLWKTTTGTSVKQSSDLAEALINRHQGKATFTKDVQALKTTLDSLHGILQKPDYQQDEVAGAVEQVKQKLQTSNESRAKGLDEYKNRNWRISLFVILLISACIPAIFFMRSNENIQKDWRGEKTASVQELGNKIEKTKEDLKGLQDAYERLKQGNEESQQRQLDERFNRYMEKKEAQETYVTKQELENRLPASHEPASGGNANH
jgi:hypothetical protein